jgi:hypothetical protein
MPQPFGVSDEMRSTGSPEMGIADQAGDSVNLMTLYLVGVARPLVTQTNTITTRQAACSYGCYRALSQWGIAQRLMRSSSRERREGPHREHPKV